ncbi:ABC transporter permease [Senegalia massiliensis]|uniref:ABC transporter permease n=1 Tax=Senegalia massiliensis TaxID=1720316 RepID=UPI0010315BCC|nr:ABC transporter permease [Senegalia massiliensis]
MKLWHSFLKEMKLAFRGFYIYIEIFIAILLLVIVLTVVPENFSSKSEEYIYFNLPENIRENYIDGIKQLDLDNKKEVKKIKIDNKEVDVDIYETSDKEIYILNSEQQIRDISEKEQKFGMVVNMKENKLHYKYYIQGYEKEKLKNLYLISNVENTEALRENVDNQDVRPLSIGEEKLTDRENLLPTFLTFNGSLMGLFIIAAYVFLDKDEGVIKAYAVTASSVKEYLLSKTMVLLLTTLVTSLIMVIPVMGLQPNYFLMILFLIATTLFSSSLGLLIASFYDNIMQAFGTIYIIIIILILPAIANMIPSWNPDWMKFFPTYHMIEVFKEIILENQDIKYILLASLGFLLLGIVLFTLANRRYKSTLTV